MATLDTVAVSIIVGAAASLPGIIYAIWARWRRARADTWANDGSSAPYMAASGTGSDWSVWSASSTQIRNDTTGDDSAEET